MRLVGIVLSVFLLLAGTFAIPVSSANASAIGSFFVPVKEGSTSTNGRILQFDSETGVFVGDVIPSQGSSQPQGMTLGPDGFIYASFFNTVSNTDGRVLRVDPSGTSVETFVSAGSGGLGSPSGLTFGPDGNLYVASNNGKVIRYDGNTGAFINVFATGLAIPQDIAFGPDGDLYVSNGVGDSIGRYAGQTGAFVGYFVAPGAFGLDAPIGIAFGPSEDLYVASFPNNTIFRFEAGSGALISEFHLTSEDGYNTLLDIVFGPDMNLYASMRGAGTAIYQIDPDTGVKLSKFATLAAPLSFNTGMLFVDDDCSQLGSVSGSASGCFAPTSVFEPSALALFGIGLAALGAVRRRKETNT